MNLLDDAEIEDEREQHRGTTDVTHYPRPSSHTYLWWATITVNIQRETDRLKDIEMDRECVCESI